MGASSNNFPSYMGGSKGSFTGQLWGFEMSLL